jgi:hypothetical protein
VPDPSGGEAVDVGVRVDEASETLRHGDHPGSSLWVVDGFSHQLLQGLMGETGEIWEKLSVSLGAQVTRPQHATANGRCR